MPTDPPLISPFQQLLSWLDTDNRLAEEKYLRLRAKLVRFFAYRGSFDPEELADETIARVGKKVPLLIESYEGDPSRYFVGVARNVHHEYLRHPKSVPMEEGTFLEPTNEEPEEGDWIHCLRSCLQALEAPKRTLILSYYEEDRSAKIENRQRLAESLGLGVNALRIKAFRIRSRLQKCVFACLSEEDENLETFRGQIT